MKVLEDLRQSLMENEDVWRSMGVDDIVGDELWWLMILFVCH